jgi:hypothetical protein
MSLADLEKAGVESVRIVPRGAPAAHTRLRCSMAQRLPSSACVSRLAPWQVPHPAHRMTLRLHNAQARCAGGVLIGCCWWLEGWALWSVPSAARWGLCCRCRASVKHNFRSCILALSLGGGRSRYNGGSLVDDMLPHAAGGCGYGIGHWLAIPPQSPTQLVAPVRNSRADNRSWRLSHSTELPWGVHD